MSDYPARQCIPRAAEPAERGCSQELELAHDDAAETE